MRVVLCVLICILAAATPAAAAPNRVDARTAALLAELDGCAPRVGLPLTPLPLDTLVALADGRSARELGSLISGRGCVAYAQAFGEGEDEVVLVGHRASPIQQGAVLWVDHGWWRIGRAPVGYTSTLYGQQWLADSRELFVGVGSGGSGGDFGVLGVRLRGATLSVILSTVLGASHLGATLIDSDHLLIEGRKLPDRPYGWASNCCLPGGHEWLFERRGGAFVAVAERQDVDPYFALSAFVGGLLRRDPVFMRDVASDDAVAQALRAPEADPQRISTAQYLSDLWTIGRAEALSWDAIPAGSRAISPNTPVYALMSLLGPTYQPDTDLIFRLDREAAGWRVNQVFTQAHYPTIGRGPS